MNRFLVTLTLSCLAISCLIYWADPRGHYHRPNPLNSLHLLRENEVWTWPSSNIDEREAKHRYLDLIPPPNTVLFGSSRAMVIGQRAFNSKQSFFNMAVTGAVLADYEAFWQHLTSRNPLPETIVIFLDPMIFNDATPSPYNHLGFDIPFRQRLAPRWAQPFVGLHVVFDAVQDFFQWQNLLAAIKQLGLKIGWLKGDPSEQFKGYHADGSITHAFWDTQSSVTLSRIVTLSVILHGKLNGLEKPYDPEAVRLFSEFLQELTAHRISVYVILPPYQPYGYRMLQSIPEYRDSLEEFVHLYQNFRNSSPDIHFCDARNAEDMGCSEGEFADLFHFNAACASKVVKHCVDPLRD